MIKSQSVYSLTTFLFSVSPFKQQTNWASSLWVRKRNWFVLTIFLTRIHVGIVLTHTQRIVSSLTGVNVYKLTWCSLFLMETYVLESPWKQQKKCVLKAQGSICMGDADRVTFVCVCGCLLVYIGVVNYCEASRCVSCWGGTLRLGATLGINS